MEKLQPIKPKYFVLDVDGVMTNGQFVYTTAGKVSKTFGANDSDALSLIRDKLEVIFISGDKRGFEISKKRIVEDMSYPLHLVSTFERLPWFVENVKLEETIFMADGIYDGLVFPHVYYSIAPANAFFETKARANFVTKDSGGEGAVAEAVLHILENFFEPFHLENLDFSKGSGNWRKK